MTSLQTTSSERSYMANITSSGNWYEDYGEKPHSLIGHFKQIFATEWGKSFLFHSFTTKIDNSFENEIYKILSAVTSTLGLFPQRRINILEAKTLAIEILLQAEKERMEVADYEAEHGIDWEE